MGIVQGPPGTMAGAVIRPVSPQDAERICEIYNHYIKATVISFEEQPISPPDMAGRISSGSATHPWLALERGGVVRGYAYAAPWKPRSAYRFTAEMSVYVSPDCVRQGVGIALYRRLLELLQGAGFHSVIGTIALPNPASVALHEKLGFVKAGEMKEIGYKQGGFVDVGYWQLFL